MIMHSNQGVVVVSGDMTMDWNLGGSRRGDGGDAEWNADDCPRDHWQPGGAAMLAELVEPVAAGLPHQGETRFVVRQMNAPGDHVLIGRERAPQSVRTSRDNSCTSASPPSPGRSWMCARHC